MAQDKRGSIGRTTRIVGRLSGDGDLVVEGRIEGEVALKGHLHVAEGGVVEAPVDAADLTVEGTIDGDVVARGDVVLRASGTLRGAIHAPRVALDEGARFRGHIEMDVDLPEELSGTTKTTTGRAAEPARGKRG